MSELHGICVPICTPFAMDGSAIDDAALRNHIDSMIEAGVDIIAVCGGTGEFPFLAEAEKRHIAEVAGKHIDGRCRFIVQTSAIRTEDAIEASKHAESTGADALLVLPPYFEGPNEDGVVWHYAQISGAISIPIMAYNIPQFSDFDITPDIYGRLTREAENVRYIKDSSADMLRIEQLTAMGAKVFCGCDYLMLYSLMAGGAGCFWGGANAIPKQAVELYKLFQTDHLAEAHKLWRRLQPLNKLLWTIPFNPVAKEASNLSGRPVGECRRPVLPLSATEKAAVKEAMASVLNG
ncbi:MAG: dihydrodipicolinate synthase family protein [Gammaproteobacteria bacterium]